MQKSCKAGFLTELSARAGFCPQSAEVYGQGVQAVVALASGGNIYKAYSSTEDECGRRSARHEAYVLDRIGGHEGEHLRTPRLESHIVFEKPFSWNQREFVSVVEQSFLDGSVPCTIVEAAQTGRTLAELHKLMADRLLDGSYEMQCIPQERLKWVEAGGYLDTHIPAVMKKLRHSVDRLLSTTTLTPVHGDFVDGNIRAACNKKYGVLDYARVGLSVPEQDMIRYASMPNVLSELSAAYAEASGYMPNKNHVRTLYNVDLALKAEMACRNRDGARARECAQMLQNNLR